MTLCMETYHGNIMSKSNDVGDDLCDVLSLVVDYVPQEQASTQQTHPRSTHLVYTEGTMTECHDKSS